MTEPDENTAAGAGNGQTDAAPGAPPPPPAWKPEAELRQENDPEGGVEVGFSKSRRQCYHLQRGEGGKVERVYHDVPEGFEFDAAGRLKAKEG